MNPEKFNLDNYLSKKYKSWPNIEKTAKTDLDFLNDLSNDTNSKPTKINELNHLTYNKESENQIITKDYNKLLDKIDEKYQKLSNYCQLTFVSIENSDAYSNDLQANSKKSELGIHHRISNYDIDSKESKSKISSNAGKKINVGKDHDDSIRIANSVTNEKITPENISLPLDNLGLGAKPPLPVALSTIIIKVLENQQYSSYNNYNTSTEKPSSKINKKRQIDDLNFLSKLLFSSSAKTFFSKIFWALLIKFYRIKPITAFNKVDNILNTTYESLLDQASWDYVNLQEMFTQYPNDKIFLVFCGLVCQVIFMIFHQTFRDYDMCDNEKEKTHRLYQSNHEDATSKNSKDLNNENQNYSSKFGKHFLVCLTIEIFTLINGNRPNLNIISMFPMEKLTENHFDDDDFDHLPFGAKKMMSVYFPNANFKNNSGNGTIVLGLMSGLLERYCQKNQSGGVGQAVGVLVKRKMRRTLI